MSRFLVHVATIATIAALALVAEMQSPGFWFLVLDVLAVMAERALGSLLVVLIAAGFLICLGYMICLFKHAPVIRDAAVERAHEKRITALRLREQTLMAERDDLIERRREAGRWKE